MRGDAASARCCWHGSACRAFTGCARSCSPFLSLSNASSLAQCAMHSWLCPSCYGELGKLVPAQARCCLSTPDCAIDVGRMGCKASCGFVDQTNATFSPRCHGMRHLCPGCFGDDPAPRMITSRVGVRRQFRAELLPLAFTATLILRHPRVVILGGYAWLTASWVENRFASARSPAGLDDPLDLLFLTALGFAWGTSFGVAWGARAFLSASSVRNPAWIGNFFVLVVGSRWLIHQSGETPSPFAPAIFMAFSSLLGCALPAPDQRRGFPRSAFWVSVAMVHAMYALVIAWADGFRVHVLLVLAAGSSVAAAFAHRLLWP